MTEHATADIAKITISKFPQLPLEQFEKLFEKLLRRSEISARAIVAGKIYFFRETPARMVGNQSGFQLKML